MRGQRRRDKHHPLLLRLAKETTEKREEGGQKLEAGRRVGETTIVGAAQAIAKEANTEKLSMAIIGDGIVEGVDGPQATDPSRTIEDKAEADLMSGCPSPNDGRGQGDRKMRHQ